MDWYLEPGDEIRRTRLHDEFGGNRQSGISPSRLTPNVLIFSNPAVREHHGYFDHWDDQGVFHYCGEGQFGDQRLTRGNRAILCHAEDGRALRVFEAAGNIVRYIGEFGLDTKEPYYRMRTPESGGQLLREAIMFRLLPVDPVTKP